jgi:hypothetical protein
MPSIRAQRPTPTRSNPRVRQLLVALVLVLLVVGIVRALFGHHENKYEKLANDITVALQANDLNKVKSYQNAETATLINRGIVGRAADVLAPLGKIKRVQETTPSGSPDRVHEFDVTFDKGAIHEKMKVDPDFKIVHFTYDKVAQ